MNCRPHYPLGESDELRAASGKAAQDIDPEMLAAGKLAAADMQIDAATLRAQAEIARSSGYPQLADNLARAAELTAVPDDLLLEMYAQLRPGRATHAELMALADRLAGDFSAPITAALVREAAANYERRGLCKTAV